MAAEECTATASPTPHSWWDLHPLSSWTTNTTSTSTTTSLTNANSNHSGLTVESPGGGGGSGRQLVDQPPVVPPHHQSNDLIGEHASDNHLWSQVLSVASNGELRNGPDVGDNLFHETISGKSSTSAGIMFEPACDYLKKIDGTGNWEFPSSSSVFNNLIKNLNGYGTSSSTTDHHHHDDDVVQYQQSSSIESETKLSNLVNTNWSIAPPHPHQLHHISLTTSNNSVQNYSDHDPAFCGLTLPTIRNNPVFLSCYGNDNHHHHDDDVKMESDDHQSLDVEAPTNSYFRRAFKGNINNGYLNNSTSMEAADNFYGSNIPHNNISPASACTSTISNYSRLSKPSLVDIHASSKPSNFRPLNLSDCNKKQGLQAPNSLQNKQMLRRNSNGRTQGIANEGKKKKGTEETTSSDTPLKKPKLENSTASSMKMQAPKVKLGDRITALQQIVSPFGKTDTASVLLEAIGYINFLQQQVQLLSNPYMKLNSHKDPWGSSCLDRKDHQKGDMKVDLRSRGLCLVPISCTPKVYHETAGSDYWTPTYRGCLYR